MYEIGYIYKCIPGYLIDLKLFSSLILYCYIWIALYFYERVLSLRNLQNKFVFLFLAEVGGLYDTTIIFIDVDVWID